MNVFTRFFASVFGGFFDKRLWTTIGAARSTTARVDVSEDTALNYAAVWCATRLLCGTGASLPLPVYRGADDDTREKIKTHPVYRLLNVAPNPEQTAFNFRSVMWQWQVNWGNAYAEIVREGNIESAPVMAIWPLHPSRVTPKRDDSDQLFYEVHEFGKEPSILEPWQVLHLPSIITYDGIVGQGVIAHARETIGAGIAAETKAAHTFGDGGVPRVVVEHPGKWNDETRAAFRKEWKDIYGGPDGDTMAVLQGGAVAKPLMGFSEKDSQFLETRQFDIEEIARWYGIPPHLLQHLLRATFNNVEELGIDFVRYGLVAWLEIWEQSIRAKLFTERERDSLFVEHNVDALMRGNAQARATFYQAMTSAAIMTRNECRKLENLDPVPGGDVYLVQGAMVPLDDDGKPESAFVSQTTSSVPDNPAAQAEDIKCIATNRLKRILTRDLGRMLRKERAALQNCAKKPVNYMDDVEKFYLQHTTDMLDVLSEPTSTLVDLGVTIDCGAFVRTWVEEGKELAFGAAEVVSMSLTGSVQQLVESKTWSERPARAIEGV